MSASHVDAGVIDTRPERRFSLLAEFATPEALLKAVRALRREGFTRLEAYTPQPVDGLGEALGRSGAPLGIAIFVAGLVGVAWGFSLQWYGSARGYPLNIGGRPLNSWPAFIPSTFELAVLTALLVAVIGLMIACRLPKFYDPVFALPEMERSTQNGYMLLLRRHDPLFSLDRAGALLRGMDARRVLEVDHG